jgi:hypothetical protein
LLVPLLADLVYSEEAPSLEEQAGQVNLGLLPAA